MKDSSKTKQELIEEMSVLKQRIQEMEQAEEALQCERDNLANILNVMDDGVYIVDQQYDIQFVNPVLKNTFCPWQGMKCYTYFHNRTEICPWCPNQKVFAGETVRWEWYSERDGKTYDLIDTPMKGSDGRILKLEIFRDITERKQVEEALRESEERHRILLNEFPNPIFSFYPDGTYRHVNRAFAEGVGKSADQIIGRKIWDVFPKDEADKRFSALRTVFSTGESNEIEGPVPRPDGDRYYVTTIVPVKDAKGSVVSAICSSRDITERKRAEEALRESEGKRNAMLQSIPDHMSMMDEELNIVWANKAATQMFGSDIIGRKCYEAYHRRKEPCEPYPCLTLKAFKDGGVHEHNTEVVDTGGKTIYFHCTANVAVKDKDDKPVTVLEISRDITEHKQAEEEIRRGNMFLNSIIENIPITIFLKDAKELRFVLLNRAGEDLTGYSSADLLGKNDYDFTPKEQADFFTEKDRDVLRGRDVVDIPEEPLQTRNQGERILHTKKVPIMDVNGEPEYLLGISEDITDRKRLEEELINHRIQLEELVKERTAELEIKTRMLEDINTALKVLLRQGDDERQELEDRFVANIKTLILPYLEKMKSAGMDKQLKSYLSIMESNLSELLSPMVHNMRHINFTPKEIMVASLIKGGKTTKDIAETMGVGTSAIDSHRNRIRKKLGLNKRNANLQSYLHSLK